MTIIEKIKACQTKVGATPDGNPGPKTWGLIFTALGLKEEVPATPPVVDVPKGDQVDARSESNIATLNPKVRPYARALVQQAAAQGITIKVISGTRTYAEQDALFNQRPKVTNARGGFSNHNFGIAFDIGLFKGSSYVPESPLYKAVAAIGKSLGLEWGGDWKSIVDEPHYQLRPPWATGSESAMLAELRSRRSNGIDAFA